MKNQNVKDGEKNNGSVRFKALDFVIIILILAAIVGVYFRYNILDTLTGNPNQKDHIVSFKINDIIYSTENYINIGDKVYYNSNSGEEIGKLIEASEDVKNALLAVPAVTSFIPDGENLVKEASYPEDTRIDASGRMLCRGTYSIESGFLLNGRDHLSTGDKISVKTDLVTVEIVITDITLAE